MNPSNKYHSPITEHKYMYIQHHKYGDKDPYHICLNKKHNISNHRKTTCTSYINGKLPLKQRKLGS